MAIYLGTEKVNSMCQPYVDWGNTTQMPGVSHIRSSLISGKFKVAWRDPDDIIERGVTIASWSKTRLVYKAYPIDTEITDDMFPQNENDYDGIMLETTTRNQYDSTPYTCPYDLAQDMVYCFRFFPCNKFGKYTTAIKYAKQCMFRTNSLTWQTLMDQVEDFPNCFDEDSSKSILPHPGGEVDLKYITTDPYSTKADYVEHMSAITAITTPFVILDYNASVPQYVKYAKDNGDGTKTYKYISSIDDQLSTVNVRGIDGVDGTMDIMVGSGLFKKSYDRCRVYDKMYDEEQFAPVYIDTGKMTSSTSYETTRFQYKGNLSSEVLNKIEVPRTIYFEGDTYNFCGYTMTIQPKNCLIANGSTTMQFDQVEFEFAGPYEKFEAGKHYYAYDEANSIFIEIDTSELVGKNTQNVKVAGVHMDIYSREDDMKMTLCSRRYDSFRKYLKTSYVNPTIADADLKVTGWKSGNGYDKDVVIPYSGIVYKTIIPVPTTVTIAPNASGADIYYEPIGTYTTTAMTCVYPWVEKSVYSVNTYIYYNEMPYKVIKATTATLAGNPDTLTAYYQKQTSMGAKNGTWFVNGDRLPASTSIDIIEQNDSNCTNYGSNLWCNSVLRQWLNKAYCKSDSWWTPMNRFDRKAGYQNNFPMRLVKNDDFMFHCIPCANITQIANIAFQYGQVNYTTEYAGNNRSIVTADRFWLLSFTEVGFSSAGVYDGVNTFKNIYYNDASRQKVCITATGGKGSAAYWWLRYPNTGNSYVEYLVYTSGASSSYGTAYDSNGCAPACTLG